jgi:hypothetical protein
LRLFSEDFAVAIELAYLLQTVALTQETHHLPTCFPILVMISVILIQIMRKYFHECMVGILIIIIIIGKKAYIIIYRQMAVQNSSFHTTFAPDEIGSCLRGPYVYPFTHLEALKRLCEGFLVICMVLTGHLAGS